MIIEEFIHFLNEFVPYPEDSTISNESYFYDLMDEWNEIQNKEKGVSAIFHLLEKYPHVDLGSPGPIVHALESNNAELYESELHKSLMRMPTPLTLWIYNRIINDEKDKHIIRGHIERLKLLSKNPLVDLETKEVAQEFIQHQLERL